MQADMSKMDIWLAELCETTQGQVEIRAIDLARQFGIPREKASTWLQKFAQYQTYGHTKVILRVNTKVGPSARWAVTLKEKVTEKEVLRQVLAIFSDSSKRKKMDFRREVYPGASEKTRNLLDAICDQVVAGDMTEKNARNLILAYMK